MFTFREGKDPRQKGIFHLPSFAGDAEKSGNYDTHFQINWGQLILFREALIQKMIPCGSCSGFLPKAAEFMKSDET